MDPELRAVSYCGFSRYSAGVVAYADLGNSVPALGNNVLVYSGATLQTTSTINCAEEIIMAIARRERFYPPTKTFYDLQTWKGYSNKGSGDFEFDKLSFQMYAGEPEDLVWQRAVCPSDVIALFVGFIGEAPIQQGNLKDKRIYRKPRRSDQNGPS